MVCCGVTHIILSFDALRDLSHVLLSVQILSINKGVLNE